MKHIDITIDIESLALSTNAAILQIAAVAWDRDNLSNPFVDDYIPFEGYVDIRSCVKDNFDFEPDTVKWWGSQTEEAKTAVLTPPAYPLKEVLENLVAWIDEIKQIAQADTVFLWAQGSDFDIANLRNAFSRYGLKFPVGHRCFRDARTFIIEVGAYTLMPGNPVVGDTNLIYDSISSNETSGLSHEAMADAMRTTKYVWRILKRLRGVSERKDINADNASLGK